MRPTSGAKHTDCFCPLTSPPPSPAPARPLPALSFGAAESEARKGKAEGGMEKPSSDGTGAAPEHTMPPLPTEVFPPTQGPSLRKGTLGGDRAPATTPPFRVLAKRERRCDAQGRDPAGAPLPERTQEPPRGLQPLACTATPRGQTQALNTHLHVHAHTEARVHQDITPAHLCVHSQGY